MDMEEALSTFCNDIVRHPLVTDYARKMIIKKQRGEILTVDNPYEALAEKYLHALNAFRGTYLFSYKDGPNIPLPKKMLQLFVRSLIVSHVIYLTQDALDVLAAMCAKIYETGNSDFSPRELPYKNMWISSTYAMDFSDDSKADGILITDAFGIKKDDDLYNQAYERFGLKEPKLRWSFRDNSFVVHGLDKKYSEALCLLFETNALEVTEKKLSRQQRRAYGRQGQLELGTPYIVHLKIPKEHDRTSTGSEIRDWYFRWIVRGHIRNQYFPSTKEHRMIWIDPYIKGPENKPFRESILEVK